MLNPHACHKVIKIEIMNGKELCRIDYYCEDCNVKCWHDGSDIHHYFDYKDDKEFSLAGSLTFINYVFKKLNVKHKLKSYKDYYGDWMRLQKKSKIKKVLRDLHW